ncbi:hypothetical protein P7K49_034095 [Saguinus oedipus]|uniref:Uncharacterized protein n=1 Tax=Saguinus oedipus TaxID=9490 RepID=A0ABQ9TTS5_SAGOE|nr:hypothetical protein P7K49_034095 [Saguinus oedipus]
MESPDPHKPHTRARPYLPRHGEAKILTPIPDSTFSDMERPRSSQASYQGQIVPALTWGDPDPHTYTRSYLLRQGWTQILTPVPDPTSSDIERPRSSHLYQLLPPQTWRDPDPHKPHTRARSYLLRHRETQILIPGPDTTCSDMGRPGSSHLDQILPHRTWRDPDPHICTRSYLFRQEETLMLIPGPDPIPPQILTYPDPYTHTQILPPQILTDPNSHKTHTRARSYLLRHEETQILIPGPDPTSSDTDRPRSSHLHGETQILTPVPDPTSLDMEKPRSLHLYQILLPQTLRDPDPNTCTRFYLLEHGETEILTPVADPTSSDIERPRSPYLYHILPPLTWTDSDPTSSDIERPRSPYLYHILPPLTWTDSDPDTRDRS